MTEDELKEIEARAAAATGPSWEGYRRHTNLLGKYYEWWEVVPKSDNANTAPLIAKFEGENMDDDSDFVVYARTDIPALCAALREAWARIGELEDAAWSVVNTSELVYFGDDRLEGEAEYPIYDEQAMTSLYATLRASADETAMKEQPQAQAQEGESGE